jgi:hypothetical protein
MSSENVQLSHGSLERPDRSASGAGVALLQRLDVAEGPSFRVSLGEEAKGWITACSMIPVAVGCRLAIRVFREKAGQGLLLGRAARCIKLDTGQFEIAIEILDRRRGDLETKIPEIWRRSEEAIGRGR